MSDFVNEWLERSTKVRQIKQAELEKKRARWAEKLGAMTDDQLREELDYANGWWADAAFEFADSGRGDGGMGHAEYASSVLDEMERRGLVELSEVQP